MSPDSKEILHNSVYRREPLHVGGRREAPHPAGVDRTEPLAPLPNRLVGDRHASLREEIFSIAESEAESRVEPDRVADDVGWESISVPQPDNTVSAEVPFRECPSRAGLQIPLEAAGVCRVTEPDRDNDTPRSMLRRMRRPTCVVGGEPASQILCQANVVLLRVLLGLQEIDDVATGHARATCKAPAEARWARRRQGYGGQPSPIVVTIGCYGSPAEARSAYRRAKAGGGGVHHLTWSYVFPWCPTMFM